jgi:hypothetical protein
MEQRQWFRSCFKRGLRRVCPYRRIKDEKRYIKQRSSRERSSRERSSRDRRLSVPPMIEERDVLPLTKRTRLRNEEEVVGGKRCEIFLPDDVLTVIGSFISWDDAYASSYRLVCKSIKFGVDLTARVLTQQTPNRLYMRFKRNAAHFGPPDTLPICVRNLTVAPTIAGSWRHLMRQVFGACDSCAGSSRWMLGCKDLGCTATMCVSCIESSNTTTSTTSCCNSWYCPSHAKRTVCKACYRKFCRTCIAGTEEICTACNNWSSDLD